MFQLVRKYVPVADAAGAVYQPRAYGELHADGTWDGWLVFFPIPAGVAVATERETIQPSFVDLVRWSATIGPLDLKGALDRALRLDVEPRLSARLAELSLIERQIADDVIALDTAAAEARADAEVAAEHAAVHETAAAAARAEAQARLEEARAIERSLAGKSLDERPRRSQAADSSGRRRATGTNKKKSRATKRGQPGS